MSSSAIGFTTITYGPTGPTGNIGNRGLIGPDGATSGATGPRGSLAPHVANVTFYSAGATVVMSDGSLFSAIGSFGGATSTDYAKVQTVDYLNPLVDSTTYSFISSGEGTSSFIMRGISASGSLVVTEDAQAIYIDSIYTPLSGAVDAASLTDNTLVYLKERNQISSTTIGVTYGTFYDGVLNFEKSASTPSFSKLLPRAKVKYVQPNYKTDTPSPVTLNVNDAGVFYIRTPNGISAFSGNFKNSEVVSFTLITESDDIWNFPTNVYFETGENYLTCGKSILNLTTFDQGNSWYATVAARGVDGATFNCDVRSLVGSCCYTGLTGTNCRDFVTRNECDAIAGTFHPLQSCVQTCGATSGVCCSNGKCLDNVSYAECAAFGGKYFFGIDCTEFGASQDPNAPNATRLCYDRCKEPVACCKDGICLGDEFTSIECQQILGGTPFPGKRCSEVDCCVQNVKVGACCVGTECSQATLVQCREANGVFLGEGEQCGSVNCGCFPDAGVPLGSCCQCIVKNGISVFSCVVTRQENCQNGTWTLNETYSAGSLCNNADVLRCANLAEQYNCESLGKCCYCDSQNNNITSCIDATLEECTLLNGRFSSGSCSESSCDPCVIPCSDCYTPTPGVRCSCDNGIRICENILDINDPQYQCNNGTYLCSPEACASSPCTALLPDCVPSTCVGSESSQCSGTTDLLADSSCDSCFPDGIIPPGSGEKGSNESLRPIPYGSSSFSGLYDSEIYYFTGTKIVEGCPVVQVPPNGQFVPLARNFIFHGYSVQDYYIPIKEEYICGNDLQFCIDIDLPPQSRIDGTPAENSIRAYVLRTWYPKYFSTNYAAYLGKTLTDGSPVSFLDPISKSDEISVWGNIKDLDGIAPNNAGTPQTIFPEKVYDNLSSFITEDGFDHVEISDNPAININTVRMIEELNCPLYGYNPRGKFSNYNTSANTPTATTPSTLRPFPGVNVRNLAGNTYAEGISYNNPFYYQSTNIGGRFGSSVSSLPGDISNINGVNGQTYNQTASIQLPDPGSFVSKMRRRSPLIDVSSGNANNYFGDNVRGYGYTDFGTCLLCQTNYRLLFKYKQLEDADIFHIKGVGYYPMQATLNRFANKFENRRLFITSSFDGGNTRDAHDLIPFGFSNPGHPLTMDYEGNVDVISSGPLNDQFDVFRYDPANPYLNINSFDIRKSPLYKTKNTSIIVDSGTLLDTGVYIPDYSVSSGPDKHNTKIFARKRKVIGAINNPWYANPNSTITPSNAETIISRTATGYKLCIKLKNYKDYILTDDQIPKSFSEDQYENLMDSSNPRNKRFLNYKNSLRIVLYSGAHNQYADNLTFGEEFDADPFGELRVSTEEYVQSLYTKSNTNVKYTLRYGCTNNSCNCNSTPGADGRCDSCEITTLDKLTNAYGSGDLESVLCAAVGFVTTGGIASGGCVGCIGNFGGGAGVGPSSFLKCKAANSTGISCPSSGEQITISGSFNCRNCNHATPCSCKTSTATNVTTVAAQDIPACGAGLPDCPPDALLGCGPEFACLKRTCNIFSATNEITGGGAVIRATELIKQFFNEFGYILNEDFWIINSSGSTYPLVIWKLLPTVAVEDGLPREKYSFPFLSAPKASYIANQFGEFYYREVVCDPQSNPTPNRAVQNCGVDASLKLTSSCINFCELSGQSCTSMIERIIAGEDSVETRQFISNLTQHRNNGPQENILTELGGPCVGLLTGSSVISKKIYISEDQFECVDMDCSSIDCTQFEDCPL